jgi:hypothetical protein
MPRRLLSERSASAGSLAAPPRLPPPAAFPFAFAADIAGNREARDHRLASRARRALPPLAGTGYSQFR